SLSFHSRSIRRPRSPHTTHSSVVVNYNTMSNASVFSFLSGGPDVDANTLITIDLYRFADAHTRTGRTGMRLSILTCLQRYWSAEGVFLCRVVRIVRLNHQLAF